MNTFEKTFLIESHNHDYHVWTSNDCWMPEAVEIRFTKELINQIKTASKLMDRKIQPSFGNGDICNITLNVSSIFDMYELIDDDMDISCDVAYIIVRNHGVMLELYNKYDSADKLECGWISFEELGIK